MKFPSHIQNLIRLFNRLPGIGPKSAERIVFALLKKSPAEVLELSQSLARLIEQNQYCSVCRNIDLRDPCAICADTHRDRQTLCIISKPQDLISVENTGLYRGLYYVLWGHINPLEGITPEDLQVPQLLSRLEYQKPSEVILAFNADIEGESTGLYLQELLGGKNIPVSRLAKGLSMGSELEYADEITMAHALRGRVKM